LLNEVTHRYVHAQQHALGHTPIDRASIQGVTTMLTRISRMIRRDASTYVFWSLCTPVLSFAQVPAEAPETSPALEEVVITGSRIAQPALESVSPITAVSAELFQARGVTNVEDLLNTLPQMSASQNSGLSQGATGIADLSLRDLGSQRTLVLINGRRLMPGDPTLNGAGSADVNNIPPALVKRVEILTGGASSTYGADAVAGVVNFIMEDHFQGVRISGDYSTYYHHQHEGWVQGLLDDADFGTAPTGTHTDGNKRGLSLLMGKDFADGTGNITAYLTYQKTNPVRGDARDYNGCVVAASDSGFQCSGSANASPTVISGNDGNLYQLTADGSFGPFYRAFNYAPDHYFQRDDSRYNAGFFAHLQLNEHAEAYGEFMFMHDETTAQYAPTAIFFSSGKALDPVLGVADGNYYLNCGSGFGSPGANPFLNPVQYGQLCNPSSVLVASQQTVNGNTLSQLALALRNVSGGARRDDYDHTSYRAVAGLRGDLGSAWKYDAYVLEGFTNYDTAHYNDLSAQRVGAALTVVNDPVSGKPVCLANVGQAFAPGCVPYNIWSPNGVTQAALNYLQVPDFQSGKTEERVLSGNITGDFGHYGLRLPGAEDGLQMNFGAESRVERLVLSVDQAYIDGDVAGSSVIEPVNSAFRVWELFTEGRLPLLQNAPLAKLLSIDFGYRYSDYDTGNRTNTYKLGLEWAPLADFRIRGSFQRAVRAPNIQELYQPLHVSLDGGNDFCANGNQPFYSLAQCERTGVTAGQYGNIVGNPASQYNGQIGGSPGLKPETALTKSFGIVITPQALPGFSATIDYFDIRVEDIIGVYGSDFVLGQCANTGDPKWCALVHRAPNGSLWLSPTGYVTDVNVNSGALFTRGIDVSSSWRQDVGRLGRLNFELNGGYISKYVNEPFGSASYDCAGLYGLICVQPLPKWRHTFNVTWSTPLRGLELNVQWRYVAQIGLETTDASLPDYGPPSSTYADRRLPAVNYYDLGASWQYRNFTIRAGVNNLLDKDPPLVGTGEGGNSVFYENNTFPGIYDTAGRQLFLSVRADL
jgi:iron complex outermembrane recepter protein